MSHRDIDPQQRPSQKTADDLALEAHALIEMLRRRRLAAKLLRAAVHSLQLIGTYKAAPPRRKGQPEFTPLELLYDDS